MITLKRRQTGHKVKLVWPFSRRQGVLFPKVKKCTKIIWLYLLWMSFAPTLHAQQDKVTYRYDAAGNRISRTIVLSSRSAPASIEEEEPVVYTESFPDIQLKIYPNPTDGLLKVELHNLPEGQTAQIRLYAMSGQLIISLKDIHSPVNVNISNQPAGIYVMKIEAGKYRTEWKIIKK